MKNSKSFFKYPSFLFLFLFSYCSFISSAQVKDTIQGAWYSWAPYQYLNDQNVINGLDYALITHIFKNAGVKINFNPDEKHSWKQNQDEVFEGIKTATGGAFWTKERNEKYLISEPYRYEWNTLYIPKDEKELSKISNIDSLLAHIEKNKLVLVLIIL